jgi:hypothetical protein
LRKRSSADVAADALEELGGVPSRRFVGFHSTPVYPTRSALLGTIAADQQVDPGTVIRVYWKVTSEDGPFPEGEFGVTEVVV